MPSQGRVVSLFFLFFFFNFEVKKSLLETSQPFTISKKRSVDGRSSPMSESDPKRAAAAGGDYE